MGVRISWLMLARNSLLAVVAASAESLGFIEGFLGSFRLDDAYQHIGQGLEEADFPLVAAVSRLGIVGHDTDHFPVGHRTIGTQ